MTNIDIKARDRVLITLNIRVISTNILFGYLDLLKAC